MEASRPPWRRTMSGAVRNFTVTSVLDPLLHLSTVRVARGEQAKVGYFWENRTSILSRVENNLTEQKAGSMAGQHLRGMMGRWGQKSQRNFCWKSFLEKC